MDFKTRYKYNSQTDLLGRGGFATVYRASDTLLGRTVALKFFKNADNDKHNLIKEISRAITLEHPNLCRYYDAAMLQSENMHGEIEKIEVGVMEYLDGGHLKTYLLTNPQHLDKLLTDVLRGLDFLHEAGIIHRDLKPQNILIKLTPKGPVAKITDFGISKDINSGNNQSSKLMGTVEYMAPEQFNPGKYGINGKIATNLDLWSFGLMVYELRTGNSMFGGRDMRGSVEQVMSNILNDELIGDKIQQVPEPYLSVLKMCLVKDAKKRVQTAGELIPLLQNKPAAPPVSDSGHTKPIPKPKFDPGATMVVELPKPNTPPRPPIPPKPPGPPKSPGPMKPPPPQRPPAPPKTNQKTTGNKAPFIVIGVIAIIIVFWVLVSKKNSAAEPASTYGDTTKMDSTAMDTTKTDSAAIGSGTTGDAYKVTDYFDDNHNNWGVAADAYGVVSIANGKMLIKCIKPEGDNYVETAADMDPNKDWEYSVATKWKRGVNNYGYGLSFASGKVGTDTYAYLFYISADHYYRIFYTKNDEAPVDIQAWIESDLIHQSNVLRVSKSGDNLSFYVNDHLLNSVPAQRPLGTTFGLRVTGKQTAEFDNFSLIGTNK